MRTGTHERAPLGGTAAGGAEHGRWVFDYNAARDDDDEAGFTLTGTWLENLRPAQETCEQCHWPKKFVGNLDRDAPLRADYEAINERLGGANGLCIYQHRHRQRNRIALILRPHHPVAPVQQGLLLLEE